MGQKKDRKIRQGQAANSVETEAHPLVQPISSSTHVQQEQQVTELQEDSHLSPIEMVDKKDDDDVDEPLLDEIRRSTHLCIPLDDENLEIAGMEDNNKSGKLEVRLVRDREQSYIEICARFKRVDRSLVDQEFQYIRIFFYVDAFDYHNNIRLKQVNGKDLEHEAFPSLLKKSRRVQEYVNDGILYNMQLSYKRNALVEEGLFDTPGFDNPKSLQWVDTLRKIKENGFLELYLRLTKNSFSKHVQALKLKFNEEITVRPFNEYISKKGNYVLQWDVEGFGVERDTYVRTRRHTFRDTNQWRLTFGWGTMRDSGNALENAVESLHTAMQCSFVEIPKFRNEDGLPKQYLCFALCTSGEQLRANYTVGQSVKVVFELSSTENGAEPEGWKAEIIEPLPNIEYSGNLVFHVHRPKGDARIITAGTFPKPDLPTELKWFFPLTSDLAPKRLVDCANVIFKNEDDSDLQRFVQGRDLRETENHGLFDNLSQEVIAKITQLALAFTPSGLAAYEYLRDTRKRAVFLMGPPGVGKTRWISIVMQIFFEMGVPVLATAPSNAATDAIATACEIRAPHMGTIRYHSLQSEERVLRYKAADKPGTDNTVAVEEKTSPDEIQQENENLDAWHAVLKEVTSKDSTWYSSKRQRPNHTSMGLHLRALQNAGLAEHKIPALAQSESDPHSQYRDQFIAGIAKDTTEQEAYKAFKDMEKGVLEDTLRKVLHVVTTCSNCADNFLRRSKRPQVAIIDETCSGQELETFLAWAHYSKTLRLIIFVGDPNQLPPTVKTKGMNTPEKMINPFADQLAMSHFERLWRRGADTLMFTEQFRATQGLEQVFNGFFYGGRITNGSGTALEDRPKSQEAIKYIREVHKVFDNIPHVFLNVPSGVCMQTEFEKSKYNAHNVIVVIHEVNQLIAKSIWTEADIAIITPYREQAKLYRQVLAKLDRWHVRVLTVDSFQGGQAKCVFLDIVIAACRSGGWGFFREPQRINVAVSRAEDHFYMVGDINTLNTTKSQEVFLAQFDIEERENRIASDNRMNSALQSVFDYFSSKSVVADVNPIAFEEYRLLDFTEAIAFRTRFQRIQAGEPAWSVTIVVELDIGEDFAQFQEHSQELATSVGNKDTEGHRVEDCVGEDRRLCKNCGVTGHVQRDCPRPRIKKLGFTLPAPRYTTEADDDDTRPVETANTNLANDESSVWQSGKGKEKEAEEVFDGNDVQEENLDEQVEIGDEQAEQGSWNDAEDVVEKFGSNW